MTDQWVVVLNTGAGPYVYGTEDEDTARQFAEYLTAEVDPASAHRLRSPTAELLSFWRRHDMQRSQADRAEFWPPRPGQIWQDRNRDRWVCAATGNPTASYLVCLAQQADDSAEEVRRLFGPMTLVSTVDPTEQECPF